MVAKELKRMAFETAGRLVGNSRRLDRGPDPRWCLTAPILPLTPRKSPTSLKQPSAGIA